jgi:hypothetical protein
VANNQVAESSTSFCLSVNEPRIAANREPNSQRTVGIQNWRSIVPLKTTRAEVEAILGRSDDAYMAIYKLKEGNLSIEYSSGPCRADRKGGWDIPDGVVISVFFSPNEKPRLSDLKVDRRKLRKVIDRHVIGIIYYVDDKHGITYSIEDGKVDYIEWP